MNAQHLINIRDNRKRRIVRRINELNADKVAEIKSAIRWNRDPVLGSILEQINRLEIRATELLR